MMRGDREVVWSGVAGLPVVEGLAGVSRANAGISGPAQVWRKVVLAVVAGM